ARRELRATRGRRRRACVRGGRREERPETRQRSVVGRLHALVLARRPQGPRRAGQRDARTREEEDTAYGASPGPGETLAREVADDLLRDEDAAGDRQEQREQPDARREHAEHALMADAVDDRPAAVPPRRQQPR